MKQEVKFVADSGRIYDSAREAVADDMKAELSMVIVSNAELYSDDMNYHVIGDGCQLYDFIEVNMELIDRVLASIRGTI